MASKRLARLNEQLKRELSELIRRDVRDPRVGLVTITGVEVRADLPDWSDEVEEGHLAMIVSFEVAVGAGIAIGEGVFQSQNVALVLPDGTAVAVRSDGRSGVNELIQGKEGTTVRDLSVRFIIDAPPEGEYTFLVRGPYGPDREMVEGEITFVVPAP